MTGPGLPRGCLGFERLDSEADRRERAGSPSARSSNYDSATRRRSKRKGRERGCWVYIPAIELQAAGYDAEEPPHYRVWPGRRRTILVQLYTDP